MKLVSKKLSIRSNNTLEILIDLNLKMRPSCHQKPQTCPKKFHQIQKLGMRQMLYKYYGQWVAIDTYKNHWLERQIDELIDSSLYFSRYSNKELEISLSSIFSQIGSKETGLQLLIICLSLFLYLHIFDFFHKSGNLLWYIQFLNIMENGSIIATPHFFNILIDMSCFLLVSSDLTILIMFLPSS